MACIDDLLKMQENLDVHLDEIRNHSERFAVVGDSTIKYYTDRDSLYKSHPDFDPKNPRKYGTSPLLVDIGKLNNSLEYRWEKLKEDKGNLMKDMEKLQKRLKELSEREANLNQLECEDF